MSDVPKPERAWEVTQRGDVWLWHCGACRWFEGGFSDRQEAIHDAGTHVMHCRQIVSVDKTRLIPAGYFDPFEGMKPWSIKMPLADVPIEGTPGRGTMAGERSSSSEAPSETGQPTTQRPADSSAVPSIETMEEKAARLGIKLIDTKSKRSEGKYGRLA